MRTSKLKRALSLALAVITIFSVAVMPAQAASISDGNSDTVTITTGTRHTYLETTNGVSLAGEACTYLTNDGITGPAYCINWGLKNVLSTKALPITGLYTSNPKTIGAFANGYPQRSLADFLEIHADEPKIKGLTEDEYAYATQVAIWSSLGQLAVEGTSFTDGRATLVTPTDGNAQKTRTFAALQIILNNSAHWTKPLKTGMTVRTEKDAPGNVVDIQNDDGLIGAAKANIRGIHKETINGVEYYTRVFYATSMTSTWKNGYFIDVWPENAPSGTIITDESNVLLATETKDGKTVYKVPTVSRKTTINENGSEYIGAFKLCMPVLNTPPNGNVSVKSSSIITQYNIYLAYNSTADEQSYVIADPMYAPMTAAATLKWATVESVYGRLVVEKVDGSGKPLTGAAFTLTGSDGKSFSGTSDANGLIEWDSLDPSIQYTLKETTAPVGFMIVSPVNVTVVAGQSVTVTVTNTSEHIFRVRKIDAQNGFPLGGAVFRFEQIDGSYTTTATTGHDGYLEFAGGALPYGSYRVSEVKPPVGYLKDESVQTVYWTGRDDVTLTFRNVRKPMIVLIKQDEATHETLENAVFNVYKDGSLITTVTTNRAGEARVLDVTPGYWEFEETNAPTGYLLDATRHGINVTVYNPAITADPVLVVSNKARPKLQILKVDMITGERLANAEFRVTKVEDATVSEYITDATGEILIENLDAAIYRAEEFMPPDGYLNVDTAKQILLEWGKTKTLKFDNIRKPVVVFLKTNALTGAGIPGATFKVEYQTPDGGLKNLGNYKTGADGRIIIPKSEPGWYVFTEVLPASGFSLPSNPVTRMYFGAGDNAYLAEFDKYYTGSVGVTGTESENPAPFAALGELAEHSGSEYYTEGEGFNWPLNSIVIKKTHAITGELLAGAAFELYRADEQVSGVPGTNIGRYTTDHSGVVVITGLEPGYYVVKEVQAPQNFLISENSQQNGLLKADGTTVLEFTFANYPYGSLLISKVDALTNTPLAGARFKVTDASGAVVGNSNGEYVTDSRGEILIPNIKPGAVVVTEIQAPENYAINTTPQTVQIGTDGKTYKVTFDNYPYGAIVLRKLDSVNHEPLAGAEFCVTTSDGAVVGTSNGVFRTSATGTVTIPNLPKGSYIITEITAPSGYLLENQSQTVAVDYGKTYTIDVYNKKMSGAQIIKIDADSKQPLKGARFTVYKMNGETVGTYETNGEGIIIIDRLEPGWYKAVETKAPDGWLLDDTPQDFQITSNQFVKLVFENRALASLQIKKLDEYSSTPLAGAVFDVRRQNGAFVGEFTTDQSGSISIPGVEPGWYVIKEIKAPQGYILTDAAKTVEVKATVPTVVTVTNRPLSGLKIIKLDSVSRQPIKDVEFVIAKMTGEKVSNEFNGYTFKTDSTGQIYILGLADGYYTVTETRAASGYTLDAAPKTVLVQSGKPTVLEVLNTPQTGLRIIKIDSLTKKGIYNVEFMIFDQNNRVVGTFYSDNNGVVDFFGDIPQGRYTIRETRPAANYYNDDVPRTIEIRAGQVTEIRWENVPKQGQIQIIKKSGDDNQINGLPAGTPLAGAVFEAYDYKTGNLVDRFVSGSDGRAVSKPLPLGRYIIKEVQAPQYYKLSDKTLDVDVEFATPNYQDGVFELQRKYRRVYQENRPRRVYAGKHHQLHD